MTPTVLDFCALAATFTGCSLAFAFGLVALVKWADK